MFNPADIVIIDTVKELFPFFSLVASLKSCLRRLLADCPKHISLRCRLTHRRVLTIFLVLSVKLIDRCLNLNVSLIRECISSLLEV